jgi:hypothetical protein
LPLTRTAEPGAKDTFTPHGNPYWPEAKPTVEEKKAAGGLPAELTGTGVKSLMQMGDDTPVFKKNEDIANKDVNPWVYEKVYDAVNPVPLSRITGPPAKETYTPYGNPYWPSKAAALAQHLA